MKMRTNKATLIALVGSVTVLVGGVFWGFSAGEPGSSENPLVTLSVVEDMFSTLETDIDSLKKELEKVSKEAQELEELVELAQRIDELEKREKRVDELEERLDEALDISPEDFMPTFEPILLNRGQTIVAGASTELILRSGTARSVSSLSGGLIDVTSKTDGDLAGNKSVPLNHLLIVPRDDGRGIRITSREAWVMVKGPYEIKD